MAVFWEHLGPIYWGQLKVSGLACTCPDESVVNGRMYLRFITPDSLKKYDLDYSEIYVTQKPSTDFDPMGVDEYLIEGKVIGKERVSETDPWNPVVEVNQWREINLLKDWLVKALFFLQIAIYGIIIKINKDIRTVHNIKQTGNRAAQPQG